LIASLAKRTERIQRQYDFTVEEATRFVEKEDRGRQRYVKANFHTRLDNDLLYHLVVNTDRIPCVDAARLIAEAARRSFSSR
jgi:cytidylate kinase